MRIVQVTYIPAYNREFQWQFTLNPRRHETSDTGFNHCFRHLALDLNLRFTGVNIL